MAQVLGLITVEGKEVLEVDQNPAAGGGTPAPIGSMAMLETGSSIGEMYIKIGASDTAWDKASTLTSGNVLLGSARKLAIYPANGYQVDDQVSLNSQDVDVEVVDQPTRSAPITYSIPNPGDAITAADFVLTRGAQTISEDKTFADNVIIQGNLTVDGTTTSLNTTDTEIEDKLITLNKNGPASSANGAGIEFEENAVITGFIKMNAARDGYDIKASGVAGTSNIIGTAANQTYNLPDEDGRLLLQASVAAGVVSQIPYFNSAEKLANPTGIAGDALTWDSGNQRLGIGTSAPDQKLDVRGDSKFVGDILVQDEADERKSQATTTTTDATNTALQTIPIPLDSIVSIETTITGRKTGGAGTGAVGDGAVYKRNAMFKNIGGVVTRIKDQSTFTSEDVSTWRGRVVLSGTNAVVEVRGSASSNMTWECTTKVQILD